MLNCFGRVLKRSLSAHLVQVKLLLVSFYLHGGWHVVTIRKPCQICGWFGFQNRIRTTFRFSAPL